MGGCFRSQTELGKTGQGRTGQDRTGQGLDGCFGIGRAQKAQAPAVNGASNQSTTHVAARFRMTEGSGMWLDLSVPAVTEIITNRNTTPARRRAAAAVACFGSKYFSGPPSLNQNINCSRSFPRLSDLYVHHAHPLTQIPGAQQQRVCGVVAGCIIP